MEVCRLNAILLTLVLLQGFFVYVCQSCSMPDNWRAPTLIEDVHSASNIIYGRIRKKFPDPRMSHYGTVYGIEAEVYCILKGPKTPRIANFTEAGYIPGHCYAANFDVNRDYVFFAESAWHSEGEEKKNLRIAHSYHNAIIANATNLMEIRKACGLNPVTRPEGSTSSVQCPVSDSDCQEKAEPDNGNEEKGTASSTKATTAFLSVALIIARLT